MFHRPRISGSILVALMLLAACGSDASSSSALEVLAATPTAVATTAPVAVPEPRVAQATPTPTAGAVPTPNSETALAAVPVDPAPAPAPTPLPTLVPAETPAPTVQASTAPAQATTAPTAVATATAEPTSTPTTVPVPTPTSNPAPAVDSNGGRKVTSLGYVTLGQASGVSISIPAANVELVGFHQASHPGAQGINAAATGLNTMILDSRSRGTDPRSAADIVIPPGEPVRAPATGTVISASTYTLYCDHVDQLVYIEPDGLPGWQVRVFHVVGAIPAVGTRVIAGETQIADGPRQLPFESQIDEFTGEPSWPHVHVEVVNTNIPDTRPPGPGCG